MIKKAILYFFGRVLQIGLIFVWQAILLFLQLLEAFLPSLLAHFLVFPILPQHLLLTFLNFQLLYGPAKKYNFQHVINLQF